MICQNCKSEQPDGSLFCSQCGTKLEIQRFCPQCNAKVAPNARFCSQCGCNLADGSSAKGVSDNVFAGNVSGSFNSTTNTTIYQQVHHESTDVVHCDICGNMLSKGSGEVYSCRHCGRLCCSNHFDKEYNMCTICSQEPRKQAEAKRVAEMMNRKAEEERKKQALMDAFGKLFEYRLNPETGKYIITGVKMKTITEVDIPSFVDEIGNGAFQDCSDLTSISIPNSVTRIGRYAFAGCKSLRNITIPTSVTAIDTCAFWHSGLTNLVIPGSVKHIPENMCFVCENLTSVTLSEGVESIGTGAFMSCKTLTFVSLPATLKSIAGMVFNQDYMLYKVNYKGTSRQWMGVLQDPSWAWCCNIQQIFPEGGY